MEAEKRDIERSIAAETQRMAQTVRSEYALAKARLEATEQAMREATGQGGLDNEDAVRLRELERTAAVNKSLFEDFLQKAKITEEQSTFRAREARVIVPAQFGGQSFPNTKSYLHDGAACRARTGRRRRVRNGNAEGRLHDPAAKSRMRWEFPSLPLCVGWKRASSSRTERPIPLPFYQIHHPLSPFSESMRTLRSGIHMSDVDQPPKIIHVTSARPGEGKTTIAISLAISAAFFGPEGRPARCRSSSSVGVALFQTGKEEGARRSY